MNVVKMFSNCSLRLLVKSRPRGVEVEFDFLTARQHSLLCRALS